MRPASAAAVGGVGPRADEQRHVVVLAGRRRCRSRAAPSSRKGGSGSARAAAAEIGRHLEHQPVAAGAEARCRRAAAPSARPSAFEHQPLQLGAARRRRGGTARPACRRPGSRWRCRARGWSAVPSCRSSGTSARRCRGVHRIAPPKSVYTLPDNASLRCRDPRPDCTSSGRSAAARAPAGIGVARRAGAAPHEPADAATSRSASPTRSPPRSSSAG